MYNIGHQHSLIYLHNWRKFDIEDIEFEYTWNESKHYLK